MDLKKGKYKHYKGDYYQVLGIGRMEDTEEEVVIYKPLYENDYDNEFWVRRKDVFLEEVEVNGKKVQRFQFVE